MASKGARATAGKVSKKGAGPQAKAAPQPDAKPAVKKAAPAKGKAKAAPAKAVAPAPKIASKAKAGGTSKVAAPPAPKAAKMVKAAPAKATPPKAGKKVAAPKVEKKVAAPKVEKKVAAAPKAEKKAAAAPKAEKKVAPKAEKKATKAPSKNVEAPKPEVTKAAPKAAKPRKANADAAASNGQSSRLEIGDSVPDVELVDHDGNAFSLASLAGQSYVLYFYPKDDTPGCTREACAFRDDMGQFEGANVRVVGVSPDEPESHVRFRDKYGLPFTLLSDAEKLAANAFGVWVKKQNYGREYMGIERSTFLVDETGKVKKVWRNVKVDGHAKAVLDAAV